MINNKILNLLKVASILLLVCTVSVRSFAENGDDGLDVAVGFKLGVQGFTGAGDLCGNLLRETKKIVCTYERTALYGAPYIRLGLAPRHSVMASYNIADNHDLELRGNTCTSLDDVSCQLAARDRTTSFQVSSAVLAYEYRTLLGPDIEGFLKAGYHDSKLNRDAKMIGINGIVLGAGFVYDENILVGYEYMDAGEELKSGHALYMGVELGL